MLVHLTLDLAFAGWFAAAVAADQSIVIPEIADYELLRKLLHKDFRRSLARLDSLETSLAYLAIDKATLRRAAELDPVSLTGHNRLTLGTRASWET